MTADREQEFKEAYKAKEAFLARAKKNLQARLEALMEDMAPQLQLRPRYMESRVKDAKSLFEKAIERGWTNDKALSANDVVGGRIVCNNTSDVEKVVEVINGCDDLVVENEERFTVDEGTGYAAVHLDISFSVPLDQRVTSMIAEVQVRTVLEDSWAVLSHEDVYKGTAPEEIKEQFRELAKQLRLAQLSADRLRDQLDKRSDVAAVEGLLAITVSEDTPEELLSLQVSELLALSSAANERGLSFDDVLNVPDERREHIEKVLANFIEPGTTEVWFATVYALGAEAESRDALPDDGLIQYLMEHHQSSLVTRLEEDLHNSIRYCSYCQPYDSGELIWVLGTGRTMFWDLVQEHLWDAYDMEAYDGGFELAEQIGVSCGHCGVQAMADLEIATNE